MFKMIGTAVLLGAVTLSTVPTSVDAGLISRACLKADRKAATRSLCGCIQSVANQTLNKTDQRLAAKFFKDPHQAQVIRQSDRSSHETFWKKYKAFGQTAEAMCRGA